MKRKIVFALCKTRRSRIHITLRIARSHYSYHVVYNWMRLPAWALAHRIALLAIGNGQGQWQSLFSDSKSSLGFCLAFSSLASISDCTRGSRRCYFDHSLGHFIRFWPSTNPVNVLSLDPTSQLIEINWFPVTRFACSIRNGTAEEGAKCQSNNAII